MEKFAIGLLIGVVGGALLTANNYKMRTLVKKSQEELQEKLDNLIDEKIREMEDGAEQMSEDIKTKAKDVKDKITDAFSGEGSEEKPKKTAKRSTAGKKAENATPAAQNA